MGLLRDVNFEMCPQEHCTKTPELLRQAGAEEELIHTVCGHGYGVMVDIKPERQTEKIPYVVDGFTSLIGVTAKMCPSGSVMGMGVSSLKKKFRGEWFVAGCSRDVTGSGAENLGWSLEGLIEKAILVMRSCEEPVNEQTETLK